MTEEGKSGVARESGGGHKVPESKPGKTGAGAVRGPEGQRGLPVRVGTAVGAPSARPASGDPAAHGVTTSQYPCLCPGEKYPITRAVCLGRQERNYDRCLQCTNFIRDRRPRKTDRKEK